MVKLGLSLWAVFFAVLAFNMMPGHIVAIIIISFAGGMYDGWRKNRKKSINK